MSTARPSPPRARPAALPGAPWTAWRRLVPRPLPAAGAVLLFASLFTQWGYDRSTVPNRPLSAWQLYDRTDIVLAVLAVAAFLAPLLPRPRASAWIRLAAALGAVAVVWHVYRTGAPGLGAKLALVGAAVIGAATVPELLPERAGRRLLGEHADASSAARALAMRTPVVAALITAVTYPVQSPLLPGTDTDESWILGLHEAVIHGLSFGGEVMFTYGPLGFLTVPRTIEPWTFRLGFAYTLLVQFAVAATLLAVARRWAGLALGAAVTVVALAATTYGTTGVDWQFPLTVVAAAAALGALAAPVRGSRRRRLLLVAGLGAFAGIHALVKLNTGLTIGLVGLVVAVALVPEARLRALGAYLGAGLAAVVVVWLALGDALRDLPVYAIRGADVIAGFAGALSREDPGREWEYLLALAVLAALAFGAVSTTRGWQAGRRLAALLVLAVVAFSLFKQGFVRHDAHSSTFFAGALLLAVVLPWPRRADGLLVTALLLVAWAATVNVLPREFLRPVASAQALRDRADVARSPGAAIAQGRAVIRDRLVLDPRAAAALRGHTFHVYPTTTAFVPLVDGTWRPLPVFQSYQAYTPRLTEASAALLRGPRAPERILRTGTPADIEDPEARMEIACRYAEQLRAPGDQQVLVRVPSRCGPDRLLGRVATETGRRVVVPRAAADELVYVRIHGLGPNLWEALRSLLWKPYGYGLRDGDRQPRLAPALAGSRILLGIPPAYDYDAPYPLAAPFASVTVTASTQGVVGPAKAVRKAVTLEFHAVKLARSAMEGRP